MELFIVTLMAAVMIGWLRGGSVARVAHLPLRWIVLLPVPFVIRAALLHPQAVGVEWLSRWTTELQGVAYGLLVLLAVVNRHLPGSSFLIAGTLANAVVIMANGGRMPVSERAIHVAAHAAEKVTALSVLRTENSLTHQLLGPETRFPWLADIIPLPRPFPFPSVASVGDFVLAFGLMWLVLAAMGSRASVESRSSAEQLEPPSGNDVNGRGEVSGNVIE